MLKLLRKFTPKEWILSVAAFVLILIQVCLTLTMPDYMSEITMLVQTEGSAMSDILAAGGMMLLCALGTLLASVATAVCAARISSNFSANLRDDLFDRVQSFSMASAGAGHGCVGHWKDCRKKLAVDHDDSHCRGGSFVRGWNLHPFCHAEVQEDAGADG